MAFQIKTTGFDEYLDPSGGAWIKCLILGEHGSGKTRSSSFWPDPIIAAAEDGLMAVADRGVPYAKIESEQDMNNLIEHIRKDALQPPEKRKYRTFVVDTVDAYQRTLVSSRLKSERKEALSGWADYGWLATKTNALIEKLQNLPINVVVLMHVRDKEDEQGGTTILVKKSALKGEAGDTIYRDFDLIGLMENTYEAENGERVLKRAIRWHSEPRFPMLRDRSGRLPRFTDVDFTPDDYYRIFGAITQEEFVNGLPASKVAEEVQELAENEMLIEEAKQARAAAPVPPNVPGGPVAQPQVPRPAPAKKAAAKKTAAKKTATAKAAAPVVPEQRDGDAPTPVAVPEATSNATPAPVAPSPDEAVPDAPTETPAPETPETAPEAPAKDGVEPDQEKSPEQLIEKELGGVEINEDGSPVTEAAAAAPEPTPDVTPAEAPAAGPICGSQPAGLEGTPVPGCGTVLTRNNAVRLSMAQLRTKTALCDECFDKWKVDN